MNILILNGPNINLLGIREPEIYGTQTYPDLENYLYAQCERLGVSCEIRQSNHEGVLVDLIQSAMGNADGIVINPAAYTHTSIAILDALKAVNLPTVEVHISDVNTRETFRRVSYAGMACEKTVMGHGFDGYRMAIEYLVENYSQTAKTQNILA